MYKGWLIYSEQDAIENHSYINWFMEEATKQNITLQLVLREEITIGVFENKHLVLLKGKKTELPHFAIVRTVEPLLNLQLEQLGMSVFNSSDVSEISNHKARTYYEVAKLGIPMVDTIFIKRNNITNQGQIPYPFVIKEATGRGGKQVYFIENEHQWKAFIPQATAADYVIQSAAVKLGKDLRVFVIGKEIVAAVLRESNTDFRANFKLGGLASLYQLSQAEMKIINKIVNHFDFGMVGIDFLIGHQDELLFNEIEDVVGSRTLSTVSNINILEKYVSFIKTKITQDS
ncbi:RimK family alpha-L-glutamate ligase [Paucisalibacillus sp. EB02]|uniref:ATP-grasp domain-containing protein n=1 Tax=Paucisalibacillus sp. EB02 TaxID=1347087 RepID=UPI0004B53D56|nr:ATP-grasp domain-containing protein [Paucisalibacillus sp. EB02]